MRTGTTFQAVNVCSCYLALAIAPFAMAAETNVEVGDAYARGSGDGWRWSIGTRGVEMSFEARDGGFFVAGFQNKLVNPPLEYVEATASSGPFLACTRHFVERYAIETLWGKPMVGAVTLDPAADNLRIAVKKGEMIGFSVGPRGDFTCDHVRWPGTFDYGDGESYTSRSDTTLEQGPMWFYMVRAPGTGWMEPMDSVEAMASIGQKIRIPSEKSGYRSPGTTPQIGTEALHPSNEYDAVRVWKAPKDGTVIVRGRAEHILGGDVDVSVLKIVAKAAAAPSTSRAGDGWSFKSGAGRQVAVGGRPGAQLDIVLAKGGLQADFHVLAFPGTPILRQWVELRNVGPSQAMLSSPAPASLSLRGEDAASYTQYWMVGGNSKPNQGLMEQAAVAPPYHHALNGSMTANYVPWTALHRTTGPKDGLFVQLDYLGRWRLSVEHDAGGPLIVSAGIADLRSRALAPGERLALPPVTIGVFRDDLDDMARSVYDWQYEYMWDFTNPDYFARTKWAVPWFYCSRNLQEQFTARLAQLDMIGADVMRSIGFEMLWDDAGWSTYPGWPEDNYRSVFRNTYEGPDFAHTLRYLPKMDMRWLLWFAGRPSAGVLDTKVGSWGNFEWRSDGVGFPSLESDRDWRAAITRFLTAHPRCSFHTCSGGSTYAHTFDIQRLANTNYFSDFGRGLQTNHYFSYLEPPDRWLDIIEPWGARGTYRPDTARQVLTMVPMWGLYVTPAEEELLRRLIEIYHYLLQEGVAGRWSYVFHPKIEGDTDFYYFQRTSHDLTRACIILKHKAPGQVRIFPRGLLPEHEYVVGFDSTQETTTRKGADLMARGITIKDQKPGELVYLGLPGRPCGGRDRAAPEPSGRVMARRETNLGHTGITLYWSPGRDDHWISHYEVRRGDRILGKTSRGCSFFDHTPGWDPKAPYAVRTVDGDGNTSGWTTATPLAHEPLTFSALGGHFAEIDREGWRAETTTDGRTYAPMAWVPPAKTPAGDLGGTPNQKGGAEGYWEGAGTARVGRGWQQSATSAACVRTWIAPEVGSVRVIGRAMKEWYRQEKGAPLRVRILQGTRQVWPEEGSAMVRPNDLVGASHDLTLAVAAGDAIRFVMERGSSPEDEIIAWMPQIIYAGAEPAGRPAEVVRIRCGAREPYTDRRGNVWSADRCFSGGRPVSTTVAIDGATPTPQDQALYQSGRSGKDFTYSIPVPPGLYSLRLKFAEPQHEWFFERPASLDINGRRVLTNFDICHAARGSRRAYEKVFHYLVPDAEGRLVLRFTSGWDPAKVSEDPLVQAIEVLPEHRSLIRVNAGADAPFVDWNSLVWAADMGFDGGTTIRSDSAVAQASPTLYDQAIYQTARAGKAIRYQFAVRPGLYTVHLKFAELWVKEQGGRPMDIEVNGRRVWKSWDPASAAGRLGMAADIRVEDIAPDKDGMIKLRLTAVGENGAILQGIEIE
ncbi:MAG: hypothetical protein JXQ73_30800 [Phycisphaerae bacterium]|nr:hypothetical protein [Phycisphaerae bacterium]